MHKAFSSGLRVRTANVIERATNALFIGGFVDKVAIKESGLNGEAQATLYVHAAGNCLHGLYLQMRTSAAGGEEWATISFFMENAIAGIEAYERSVPMPHGMMVKHLVPVLGQIGGYAEQSGASPGLMSAREVGELDKEADVEGMHKLIAEAQEKFRAATAPMFL